jgi:hypothetical protein
MTCGLPGAAAYLGFLAPIAVLALSPFAFGAASAMVATPDSPARLCLTLDPPAMRELRRGDRRLIVVVHAFQPGEPPLGRFVVSLVGSANSKPVEVTRFAVHPLGAFSAEERVRQQRFLVSLEGQASMIEDNRPVCVEVAFDAPAGAVKGAMAEVGVELADESKAPEK